MINNNSDFKHLNARSRTIFLFDFSICIDKFLIAVIAFFTFYYGIDKHDLEGICQSILANQY